MIVCLLTGTVIGTVIGALVAYLGIPSFVVTLALFLGLQGVLLKLIGEGGTIADPGQGAAGDQQQQPAGLGRAGCSSRSWSWAYARCRCAAPPRAGPAACSPKATRWCWPRSPWLAVLLGALDLLPEPRAQPEPRGLPRSRAYPRSCCCCSSCWSTLNFVLGRTAFGRHVYAVGGNDEAARRAGINVKRVKHGLLHDRLDARRGRRHPHRQPGQLDLPHHRWRGRPCCTRSAPRSSAAPASSAARARSSTRCSAAWSSR